MYFYIGMVGPSKMQDHYCYYYDDEDEEDDGPHRPLEKLPQWKPLTIRERRDDAGIDA
jgi:hypothetical protein